MKRLQLPLGLAILVLIMGGLGIYREAGVRLSHALERFQSALPAGAVFHYGKVRPAFLLGGVTLYDVSFHYQDTSFHARRVRFGYPKMLSSGTLSLASLLLDAPSYTNRTHQITATEAAFHHLLIPSSAETLHEGHGEADSMRSLAAIMSFEPEDVTALRFEHMQLTQLHVLRTDTAPEKTDHGPVRPFTIQALSAGTLVVEGYGQGMRVHTLMNGLSLSVQLPEGKASAIPPVLKQILLPSSDSTTTQSADPMEMHLALDHLEARQGYIQWLKRPFQHTDNPAESFWQDPAATLWEKPGKLEISGLSLLFNQQDLRRTLILAHLSGERRGEKDNMHTEADLQGLTTRLSPPPSLIPSPVSMPADYHISTTTQQRMGDWHMALQLHTVFGKDSPTNLTAELSLPDINPLHMSDDSTSRFLQAGQCLSTELTVQGLDIFSYYGILNHQPAAASTDENKPAEGTENTTAATETTKGPTMTAQGYVITPRFSALALQRPILAPVLDFLLSPERRALSFKTGPLSLEELAHISTDNSDDARFDRLHVLSVVTQEQ